jgi:hypothetical protein
LEQEDAKRIQLYLLAVMTSRGFPLHLTVAWNALHFNYMVERGGYDATFLNGFMPEVPLKARTRAVPVGALCWIQLGGKVFWAEVVGKDRREGELGSGMLSPEVSGARLLGVDGHGPVVSEALVVDFDAFEGAPAGLEVQLGRMARRGLLDPHRQIVVEAQYDSEIAANDEDRWFYARWLEEHQREMLLCGPLAASLSDRNDPETLKSALAASMRAVDDLLSTAPGVSRWGDYFFPTSWIDDVVALPNLPLAEADLEHVMHSMASSVSPAPRYVAIATELDAIAMRLVAPDRTRPDAQHPDLMRGPKWLRVVAIANRFLANSLGKRAGILETSDGPRHLRIDDMSRWGGIWRSSMAIPRGHPLHEIPVDVPLGMGAGGEPALAQLLELTPEGLERSIAAASPAEDSEPASHEPVGQLQATLVSATVSLRTVDLRGEMPLPDAFAYMTAVNAVSLRLSHTGSIEDDQVLQTTWPARDKGIARLRGVSWPPDFFPGIKLFLTAVAGVPTVFAMTSALDEPVEVDGKTYWFAYDPHIVEARSSPREMSMMTVLLERLARHGRLAEDGRRRGTAIEIAVMTFGSNVPGPMLAAVTEQLRAAVERGQLQVVGDAYVLTPSARTMPRRVPSGWDERSLETRDVRIHWVVGFLRLLPGGYRASSEAREGYRAAVMAGEVHGPEELPAGYTFVRSHNRGGGRDILLRALEGNDGRQAEVSAIVREWLSGATGGLTGAETLGSGDGSRSL